MWRLIPLALLIICPLGASAQSDAEVERLLQKAASDMRRQLPQRVNGATLITVIAGPGRRIQYSSASDLPVSEWTSDMKAHSRRIAINDYCTNPSMEAYRAFGVTASWQLSDLQGRHIVTNTVSPRDCR